MPNNMTLSLPTRAVRTRACRSWKANAGDTLIRKRPGWRSFSFCCAKRKAGFVITTTRSNNRKIFLVGIGLRGLNIFITIDSDCRTAEHPDARRAALNGKRKKMNVITRSARTMCYEGHHKCVFRMRLRSKQ
jgi:hypothetical protein